MPAGLPRHVSRACVALLALLISAVGGLRIVVDRLDEPTALECRCDRSDDGARLAAIPAHPVVVSVVYPTGPVVAEDGAIPAAVVRTEGASTSVLRRGSAGGPRAP